MNKEKARRALIVSAMVVMSLGLLHCSKTPRSMSDKAQQDSVKQERQDSVRAMANKTLAQLYTKHPAAQGAITKAAGYAVFSDFGFKVWTLGGAHGKGVAVRNATKQDTFMEMLELQPGMGLGASKYRVVMVFETLHAFNSFVNSGWEVGADAMAEAKSKTEGGALAGAVTASKGVKMFQLDEEGLIVGVSLTAAKFRKDKELN